MKDLAIYCADIGSISRGRFGWARAGDTGSLKGRKTIDALVDAVAVDLARRPVALGFECPLWLPIPTESADLGHARPNEGKHPWSAGAGAAVIATGLAQITWILRKLRAAAAGSEGHISWHEFRRAGRGLFLWEAFVSGAAKSSPAHSAESDLDVRDARIAADAFAKGSSADPFESAVEPADEEALSLLGAVLLQTGWSEDVGLLRTPPIVLKPTIA